MLEEMKTFLQREGFRVLTARNGREQLVIASSERPDLVLLDWMLSEKSGIDVCIAYINSCATSAHHSLVARSDRYLYRTVGIICFSKTMMNNDGARFSATMRMLLPAKDLGA